MYFWKVHIYLNFNLASISYVPSNNISEYNCGKDFWQIYHTLPDINHIELTFGAQIYPIRDLFHSKFSGFVIDTHQEYKSSGMGFRFLLNEEPELGKFL